MIKINMNKIIFNENMTRALKSQYYKKWGFNSDCAVHATHCTVEEGCKYGDCDCPVAYGQLKQCYSYDPKNNYSTVYEEYTY